MINIINNLLKKNFFFICFLILASLIIYTGEVIAGDIPGFKVQQGNQSDKIQSLQFSSNQEVTNTGQERNNSQNQVRQDNNLDSKTVQQTQKFQTLGQDGGYQQTSTSIVNLQIQSSVASGSYDIEIVDGNTTAFEVLDKASKSYGFEIEYQDWGGDLGKFITRISNIDTPSDYSYFWSLYYNNSPSMVGASSLILHVGDTVSWRYIKSDW